MKARPILFNGDMVRALLNGTKTQTRRVVKPQPTVHDTPTGPMWEISGHGVWFAESVMPGCLAGLQPCPYGRLGDLLWVRETWWQNEAERGLVAYRADGEMPPHMRDSWRPSIHMPRWASRLTSRITDVRAERLQDISEEDAKREGCVASEHVELADGSPCYTATFRALWTALYGIDNPSAWDANPWVWALTFDVLHTNVSAVLEET